MSKRRNTRGGSSAAKARTTDKVIRAIALLLVLIAAAYVITSLVLKEWNPVKWVKRGDVATEEPDKTEVIAITSEGKKLLTSNAYAMPRAMAFVTKQSAYAKSKEFTVTAELSNKYINGKFDWTVEFVNPASAWATGKVAEYYVQAIPTSDGSATATIKYISSFSEQIQVTATLRGSDSSDACTVDCLKEMDMRDCWINATDFEDGTYLDGGCELYAQGDGTALADYKIKYAIYDLDSTFVDAVKSYLKFDIELHNFEFSGLLNNTYLSVEEQFDNRLQLSFYREREITYADFIENFDAFDDEHKEAVYYAWYRAALDPGTYMQIEFVIEAYCNGVDTTKFTDETVQIKITGENFGKDVKPSVTLNQNIVF